MYNIPPFPFSLPLFSRHTLPPRSKPTRTPLLRYLLRIGLQALCVLLLLLLLTFLLGLAFTIMVYQAKDLSPAVASLRDQYDSCYAAYFAHFGHATAIPFYRKEACSPRVLAASERGKAGVAIGKALRAKTIGTGPAAAAAAAAAAAGDGEAAAAAVAVDPPPLDGCEVSYDPSADPFSPHALPRSYFSANPNCRIEWVVYSSNCKVGLNRLADFCHMAGVQLSIVGMGLTWRGFGGRIRRIRDYLRSLPPDRIVLSTDADDVTLMPGDRCGAGKLLEAFLSLNAPVVFGGEVFCYPEGKTMMRYYPPRLNGTHNRYLNAGTTMGYAWALIKVIDSVYVGDCMHDQRVLTLSYLAQAFIFPLLPRKPSPGAAAAADGSSADGSSAASGAGTLWGRQTTPLSASAPSLWTSKSPFVLLPAAVAATIPPNVTPEQLQTARDEGPPPFIKLDHYNALFMLLGGHKLNEFNISGEGMGAWFRSNLTGGEPCILHQQGEKIGHLVTYDLFDRTRLDEARKELDGRRQGGIGWETIG